LHLLSFHSFPHASALIANACSRMRVARPLHGGARRFQLQQQCEPWCEKGRQGDFSIGRGGGCEIPLRFSLRKGAVLRLPTDIALVTGGVVRPPSACRKTWARSTRRPPGPPRPRRARGCT
jgi:hypothetical protein